ncbi:MAG: hypothetical protein ACW960_13940, partial [Candidatus Thorarchaeota archaeon]
TVAAFYIGYFEGGILDLYLVASQNITSPGMWLVLELLLIDRQISITFLVHITLHSHVILLRIT